MRIAPTVDASPTGRSSRNARHLLALLVLVSGVGCAPAPLWQLPASLRAPDDAVSTALGDFDHSPASPADSSLPSLPVPTRLRPCCAFGTHLRAAVGEVPVPGFTLDNIVGPSDIGPHKYNVGLIAVDTSDERGLVDQEHNGLVYTCRGGFIDVAHVRDMADLTLFLATEVARRGRAGGAIALPEQGGTRRILLQPTTSPRMPPRAVIIGLAQWLAFQLSVWHEIASWYGYSTMETWPEKVSAFSPEDLYSNLVGIKIAGGLIPRHEAEDEREYNRSMDAWILQVLERLDAVPQAAGEAAMRAVDGIWWDSTKRLPDWRLVRRRNLDIGPSLSPWVVSMAVVPATGSYDDYNTGADVLVLDNPSGIGSFIFADMATVEIEVSDQLTRRGFPLPRRGSRHITQTDFPWLVERIRAENEAVFGPGADRPESAPSTDRPHAPATSHGPSS